jgi:AbrB family looped-hinge helix DNA binding protein
MEVQATRTYHTKLDGSGRIVLPAELRQRHHLAEGDTLVVIEDEAGVHVKPFDRVVREAQAYFRQAIPQGVSLADDLAAERRAEADRE